MLELAQAGRMPCEVREILETELRLADEIWLTSSTREVLAITRLNDVPVGNGKPGPMFSRMYAAYQDYKKRVMRAG